AYCAENTFDVSNMKDNCTTSILVRLQLNSGLDFYTTSVTGQDIVFQLPRNEISEEGTSASSSFCRRMSGQDIVFQLPRNEISEEGTSASSSFSRRMSGQ
ncbi:hypothetical protein, partial [Klebsiella pneumoniae]|uniref:hypothetical protein n=1 Tax=Klebsiella pneumoniae TaxID=573 RepID=UPI001E368E1A